MIKIKATPKFIRLTKKAMTPEALQGLIDTLAVNPEQGVIIRDTGGIRKLRWATGKGGGKRDGLRVLYYFDGEHIVLLMTLFKKSDQENIDASEKAEMRKLIDELLRGE
ncbi:MAG: type II toxin-antitoxin system RelE/ParE family toxin [Gammaproteobacteria bacterium]